jgi:hypothetical protein
MGKSLEKISPLGTSLHRIESKFKSIPSSEELKLYNRKARYMNTKAEKMLSYKPLVNIDQGLEISIQWLSDSMLQNQERS